MIKEILHMGPLTESMQRLCGEIVALRGTRLAFVRDLGQDVATQIAGFHQARAEMARETKTERQSFVKSLTTEVAGMLSGFRRSHKDMARKTTAERRTAMAHLKKSVEGWRRDFAFDLAGAHRAWFGPSPDELQAKAEEEHRRRAEAAKRAQEAAEERERQIARTMASGRTVEQHEAKEETQSHRPGRKKG
jgi:hypothetical protein